MSCKIYLRVGDLVQETADVLVNTIGTTAKLIAGSVSYAILEAGGNSLQEELTKHCPYGLKVGEIAQTNGGKLNCKKVFHVVLKQWMNVNDEAEKILRKVVTECLQWAEKQNFTSIAFPALGAGFHRFPANRSADIMFEAVEAFGKANPQSKLKKVKIALHRRDEITKKDFIGRSEGKPVDHKNYFSRIMALTRADPPTAGVSIQVVIGCLSKLTADVLINTTQTDLNLSVGGVSRTLSEKAGPVMQQECRQKCPSGLATGQMVQTQGGNLPCKKVFHLILPPWDQGKGKASESFQALVMACLKEAAKNKFRSIGFPVLGGGFLNYPPEKSADLILTTAQNFLKETKTQSIQTISIVVAHKDHDIKQKVEMQVELRGEYATTASAPGGSQAQASAPGSQYVAGEKAAMLGGTTKYFPLVPGQLKTSSAEEQHFKDAEAHFFKSLIKDDTNRHIFEITKVEYVVNPVLRKNFRAAQDRMVNKSPEYGVPVYAYHGTSTDNVKSICEQGFRQPDHEHFEAATDVGWYGNGIYLSEFPRFAMNYMNHSQRLLLCQVLQGKVYKCKTLKLGDPKEPGHDSHVDPFGKELVIYDDDCILPVYIIHFNICKRFKKKDDEFDPNEDDDCLIEYLNEMQMHKGEQIPKSSV